MDRDKIRQLFGGRLVGNIFMKEIVCKTLCLLPHEIVDYITRRVWILSSDSEAWAFTFTGNDLKDKHLIFLSDELLSEDKSQIQFTLLHEIGHVILGHKNSINYKQTKAEINKQERQANQFAGKYLGI